MLTGQVAIVTGGGRGLGRAFAEGLAGAGASVAVVARSAEQLKATVAAITDAGGRALAVPMDIADRPATERLAELVERELGPVDLLVNNAGVLTPLGTIWEVDPDEWWKALETNVRGSFLCTRAIVTRMLARKRGRVINVVSSAGLRPVASHSAYVISKAALIRLTEILALEGRPHGVTAFSVHPGMVRTAMTEYLADSELGRERIPWVGEVLDAGREDLPAPAVKLVLFLAEGRGDALTGRFLRATDDVQGMVARAAEIEKQDLYTMRLRLPLPEA